MNTNPSSLRYAFAAVFLLASSTLFRSAGAAELPLVRIAHGAFVLDGRAW